jgi:hypothetical protein
VVGIDQSADAIAMAKERACETRFQHTSGPFFRLSHFRISSGSVGSQSGRIERKSIPRISTCGL